MRSQAGQQARAMTQQAQGRQHLAEHGNPRILNCKYERRLENTNYRGRGPGKSTRPSPETLGAWPTFALDNVLPISTRTRSRPSQQRGASCVGRQPADGIAAFHSASGPPSKRTPETSLPSKMKSITLSLASIPPSAQRSIEEARGFTSS